MHCFLSDSLRNLAGDCRALKVGGRVQALVGPGQATPLSKLHHKASYVLANYIAMTSINKVWLFTYN